APLVAVAPTPARPGGRRRPLGGAGGARANGKWRGRLSGQPSLLPSPPEPESPDPSSPSPPLRPESPLLPPESSPFPPETPPHGFDSHDVAAFGVPCAVLQ